MKKASLHYIFWILFTVAFTFLLVYAFMNINTRYSNILARDLKVKQDNYKIPVFEMRDVSFTEAGSVANLTFNLVNMGDPITLKVNDVSGIEGGWILEFRKPDGSLICRTTVFTGDPTESASIMTDIIVPDRGIKLSSVSGGSTFFINSGEVATVSMTILKACLSETVNYARTGEKMVVRLIIPPGASEARLECTVDPATGFASCTS